MKRKLRLMLAACLPFIMFMASSMALGGTFMINVKTDKTVYLMDPYYWVYSAAKFKFCGPHNPILISGQRKDIPVQ